MRINDHAALVALAIMIALGAPARAADEADPEAGRALAQTLCAQCHAISATGDSPMAEAPAFRDLKNRYPVESLEEALAEGIVTGHPNMPEVALEPDMVIDFIAYLKSL